jgi:hypothetical protein
MDGTQVGILKKGNQVCFDGLLQGTNGGRLKSQVGLEVLGNFSDQSLKGQFSDQKLSRLLKSSDFSQGNGTRLISVGLLNTTRRRGRLSGSLGSQLLSRCFATSGLSSCLLCSGHYRILIECMNKKQVSKRMTWGLYISNYILITCLCMTVYRNYVIVIKL